MEIKDIISSGLLEMYILGLTSVEEKNQVEGWVNTYPEISAELNAIETAMESYAMANAIEPAKGLKQKIFSLINSNHNIENYTTTAKVYSISPFWKWAAAASILLLIGSSILNVVYFNKYDKVNTAYNESQQQLLAQNEKGAALRRLHLHLQHRLLRWAVPEPPV